MPYINDEMITRSIKETMGLDYYPRLEAQVDAIIYSIKHNYTEDEYEGVCNYCISRIVAGVMKPETGWRYKWLNRAYGTFMSAGAEFYRRLVGPYEDKCIDKNGDIPEYAD